MNFTEEELEVAAVLLKLDNPLIRSALPLCWGRQKRRSAEDPSSPHRLFLSHTKYSTPIITVSKKQEATPSNLATPLSSPHCDSSIHKPICVNTTRTTNRSISRMKRVEELRKNEDNFIQCNELLKTEIKKKRHLLGQLIESNKLWRASQVELNNGSSIEESSQLVFNGEKSQRPTTKCLVGSKPLIVDNLTAMKGVFCPCPIYPLSSNSNELGTMIKENGGPHFVNSTNYQSFDYSNKSLCREMAAQARRRRLQIFRGKIKK